jgi:hypothetical protein
VTTNGFDDDSIIRSDNSADALVAFTIDIILFFIMVRSACDLFVVMEERKK